MTRDEHLAKVRRVIASLEKLAPETDAMCVVDGAVIAGYHLGNALLHATGVCADDTHFNTPSKLDRPVSALPREIQPAFEAFAELEGLRSKYVRSPTPSDAALVKTVWRSLQTMRRANVRTGNTVARDAPSDC